MPTTSSTSSARSTDQLESQTDAPAPMGHTFFGWVFWPLMFLAVYALSVGPTYKLILRGFAPQSAMSIYRPLFALTTNWRPANNLMAWHLDDVWLVLPRPKKGFHRGSPPASIPEKSTFISVHQRLTPLGSWCLGFLWCLELI